MTMSAISGELETFLEENTVRYYLHKVIFINRHHCILFHLVDNGHYRTFFEAIH